MGAEAAGVVARRAALVLGALFLCCTSAGTMAGSALHGPLASKALLLDAVVAGNRVVAVGERGIIIYSDDDGDTWLQARVPVHGTLTATHFYDASRGWAVGDDATILHTVDGGLTWAVQRQNTPSLDDPLLDVTLMDVWFGSAEQGIAVGANGTLFSTDNGGHDWAVTTLFDQNEMDVHLFSIDSDSAGNLYVATEKSALLEGGGLFISRDGGVHWDNVDVPYEGTLTGSVVLGEGHLIVFGLLGNAFLTRDFGANWQRLATGTEETLLAGIIRKNGDLVMAGLVGSVLKGTRDGALFSPQSLVQRVGISALVETAAGGLLAFGQGGVHPVVLR